MKRVITAIGIPSESNDNDGAGRCLKRANSSFAVDELNPSPSETISGMSLQGGVTSTTPLLVDSGEAGALSSLKASTSGLFPLAGSDDEDDVVAPGEFAASSCSSSDIDGWDDTNEGACKASQEGKDAVDDAPAPPVISSRCLPGELPLTREAARKTEAADRRTGLVFEAGSQHFDRHNRFHKERPIRVTSVHDYLANAKPAYRERTIFERCQVLEHLGGNACVEVGSKKSPVELWLDDCDYLRVHLPGYMQRLDRLSKCNCHDRLDIEAAQFKSIYFNNESAQEAKAAASSLCNLVSRVVSGSLDNGFAVIRPPGHHAEPGLAGGYCVINNVAVAAAYAQEKLGMKKVLIVDWDVHHGNGTQRCFINNPNVLYFSAHRYHGGNFFPFSPGGGPASVGVGAGAGFNINVGWNEKRMGDDEYLVLWEALLMPVATEFAPDLVLVSAGFDAARGDMGECEVSPECFARLARRLRTLARGRLVCALEGGYVRSILCKCIESVLASLLEADGHAKGRDELQHFYKNVGEKDMFECINSSAAHSIRGTMEAHSKYWDCLKPADGDK